MTITPYLLCEYTAAGMKTRVEELEALNHIMRDRDKLKDDAIAHLSDQLIALTARLDSIEKRQLQLIDIVGTEPIDFKRSRLMIFRFNLI